LVIKRLFPRRSTLYMLFRITFKLLKFISHILCGTGKIFSYMSLVK